MKSPAKCVSAGSSGTTTDGQHEKSDRRLLILRLRSILSINDLRWRRVFARRDRLTIFSLLFGIPLQPLTQDTNNPEINVTYLYLVSWIRLAIRRVSESWFFWGLASPQKKAAGDEFVCTLNL